MANETSSSHHLKAHSEAEVEEIGEGFERWASMLLLGDQLELSMAATLEIQL